MDDVKARAPVLNGPPKQKRQKPRIENGEIVPDVRRREIRTYDLMIDEAMEWLPKDGTVDFGDPDMRDRLRNWLGAFVQRMAHDIERAYRRAADSALQQANTLMRDPNRYERQHASRKAKREEFQRKRDEAERERLNRLKEQRESIENLIAEGKVTLMPGRAVWNLPCCTGKPDELSPRFCHRCHHEHAELVDGPCGTCQCGSGPADPDVL